MSEVRTRLKKELSFGDMSLVSGGAIDELLLPADYKEQVAKSVVMTYLEIFTYRSLESFEGFVDYKAQEVLECSDLPMSREELIRISTDYYKNLMGIK